MVTINNYKDVLHILRASRHAGEKVIRLENRVEDLRSRAEKGYGYSITAGHGDGIGDGAAALADAQSELDTALVEFRRIKYTVIKLIKYIEDERIKEIMYLYCCRCVPWSRLARRYGMTYWEITHLEIDAAKKIYKNVYINEKSI